MNNQAIDSVPLHWAAIEAAIWGAFADGAKDYRGCTRERLEELRALLDAKRAESDTVLVSARWTDWSMVTLEIDGRHRTYVECGKPAAQPQGEPVEIGYIEHSREFESEFAPVINRLIWTMPIDQRHKIPQHYKVMLYAKQPTSEPNP